MELDSRIAERLGAATDPADAQFRLLVDSVTDYAIFMLDTSGRVISWNAGAERIKGYSAAEILGRHFSLFYPVEERSRGKPAELLRHAEREGHYRDEGWRLRKDGSRFWAEVVFTALRDRSGVLSGFAKVTRDMTMLRQAHERMRASEARLHTFTENSPAMLSLKDTEGRYRLANPQFLQRFGLRLEQVIGRTDAELFPGEQAAVLAANDAEVLSRGLPLQAEQTVRSLEGEHVNLVVKFALFDAAGRVSGVGAVATDITERKRTEQALLEQRTLLEEAQKVAGLGCWEWDPGSGRVTWSAELYRMYGVDPESFQPGFESYLERLHPEDRERTSAMLAQALVDGRGFTNEERIVRPDGSIRTLRSHSDVLRDAGR
jgi:PAS domain S-box-containing protein